MIGSQKKNGLIQKDAVPDECKLRAGAMAMMLAMFQQRPA